MPFPPRLYPLVFLLTALVSQATAALAAPTSDPFRQENLAAWCIVPFDAGKRGPEARAAMLEKLALKKFVYDYRKEHIPQWDEELEALKRHRIELLGWWFPGSLNDEAKAALALFQRHGVKPQLWVTGNGGSIKATSPQEQQERIAAEVARLTPICQAAAAVGCNVGLYNHGSWFGEPENAIAIIDALKRNGLTNAGIVYNLHHGHGHLQRIEELLAKMLPHLLCLNLNGMDIGGDSKGRKILPLGVGGEDLRILKIIRNSGYRGPIGILNHTHEDAEARLQDNLDGLRWLLPQMDGKAPGPRPKYRTWKAVVNAPSKPGRAAPTTPKAVPSLDPEFGTALQGALSLPGKEAFRTLPLTIECRAKLNSAKNFNILIAHEPKASATHWELYSYKGSGVFSLFLPGRGGEFKTRANICDGQWHDLVANIESDKVTLWVDGKQVLEKPAPPLTGETINGELAFGQLPEGGHGCDGLIDDVRLSRGAMKPRKGGKPRQPMDITLALWNFDDLSGMLAERPRIPDPAPFNPARKPLREPDYAHWQAEVNRERVFDYYGKQAVQFKGKPLPELLPGFPGLDGGQQGHWGNQNDAVTWRDGRFAASNLGPVFSTVFKGAGLTIPKGVCVRFGDKAACFDPDSLTFPVIWSGGFLKLSDARHGFMGGGVMEGAVLEKAVPKPAAQGSIYRGFYRHGEEVIFSYTVGGKPFLATARDGRQPVEKLAHLTKGGPTQWPQWLKTTGRLGSAEPFATDTLTIPFNNPYGTLFFISGHDFFSDGRAAISTMTGEVWLVDGIDHELTNLRWKRFATGLHQPLGVKVVKDRLYVLGRDQITCLQDLNGDDEADFYECVSNVQVTSPGGHDYITGLDVDEAGRFYFASGNQGICRVNAATQQLDVLATGFRNPNGIGLSPDARFITTSVQEGDWTPASEICQIEIGKNEGAHFGAGGPKAGNAPALPLLYLPRGEDNSSGGQCFISGGSWDAIAGDGNLVHFSPGTGSAFMVMRQRVNEQWQAAAVRISGNFDSGAQSGRFHPRDGHLYVTGMQGWGSYTPMDGCFHRVRYTASGAPFPTAIDARDNGILLRFDRPLDAGISGEQTNHFAQCWNYRYSAAYGSPELSLRYPDTTGHDPLDIGSSHVLDDGRSLFLEIPQLTSANIIHLHVATAPGVAHDIFLTAHNLAPAYTGFPGYTKIAKTHRIPTTAATPATVVSKPNPWAKGEPGRVIVVDAALGLQFVQKQLTAKPRENISLTFKNPDVVPHNWLLAKPGSLQKLGDQVNLMITDPQGLAKHYVPESPDVLAYTDMTNPQGEFTIHFQAPDEKGDYPFLCTFPGHWMVMNGVLTIK